MLRIAPIQVNSIQASKDPEIMPPGVSFESSLGLTECLLRCLGTPAARFRWRKTAFPFSALSMQVLEGIFTEYPSRGEEQWISVAFADAAEPGVRLGKTSEDRFSRLLAFPEGNPVRRVA